MKFNKLYLVALVIFITTTLLMFWSQIDGDSYFAISPKVPLFNALEGLSKGDEYMFNNKKFKIESIL